MEAPGRVGKMVAWVTCPRRGLIEEMSQFVQRASAQEGALERYLSETVGVTMCRSAVRTQRAA